MFWDFNFVYKTICLRRMCIYMFKTTLKEKAVRPTYIILFKLHNKCLSTKLNPNTTVCEHRATSFCHAVRYIGAPLIRTKNYTFKYIYTTRLYSEFILDEQWRVQGGGGGRGGQISPWFLFSMSQHTRL